VKSVSKTEKTRQFIIETTAGIFNEKGYAGTSLSDLTHATKLTKGSIYGNFENKHEVALAAFDFNWNYIKQQIAEKKAACSSSREKILVYANAYHKGGIFTLLKGGCPLLNTAVEADDTNDELRKKAADGFLSWKMDLETIITEGISAGEFKSDTPIEKIALTVIALVEGSILLGKATKSRNNADLILSSIHDMVGLIEIKK